ncbi:MAG TPA: PAS domain S-box protein [Coleofasciculaceae cyanobacterium]
MKRDATGKFVSNWNAEIKHRVSISLTDTAWRSLDQKAQQCGISRSEVIEHFARSLTDESLLASDPCWDAPVTDLKVATILESITDAFVAFDRDWRYTYVNRAAAQVLQKLPAELLGQQVWDEVFPERVGSVSYQEMQRAVAEQVPVCWEEFDEPMQRWLEANAYPSAEGLAVYFRDITDRKQAEAEREQLLQALQTERTRFEAVLHQLPAGVLIADAASGKLVLANEQARQLVGYPYEQFLQLEDYEPITPFVAFRANGQRYAAHEYPLARSLQQGEVISHEEMELRRVDGSRTFISVNSAPILDNQEQIVAAVVVLQDVTERKQAEVSLLQQAEILENQQKWLESVLDLMPTPMVFIEPETAQVIFSNRIANQLAGGDLRQSNALHAYADPYYCTDAKGDRLSPERMPMIRVARGERLQNYEIHWHTSAGMRSMLFGGEILPAMYGHPQVGIGMFQDITRLKQTEEHLRQTEERLQLALSSAQMVAWDMDLITHQVVCSPNALSIWGVQVGTAEDFIQVIHPEDRQQVRQAAERAIAGEQFYAQEYRLMDPDGRVRWLNSQGQVYLDETGRGIRMAGVSMDITERKQIEVVQVQTQRQIKQLLIALQQKERQQQFLIELNDEIRTIQDSKDIILRVAVATGSHFNVTRCTYAEIDTLQEHLIIDRDFCAGVSSAVGQYSLNRFGADLIAELKQGKTIVVEDVATDPRTAGGAAAFAALQTQSCLGVPLVKAGQFLAVLMLHQATPRCWTEEEVGLMERIAQKTWLAVERSRAEEALRESEARLQLALKVGRMGTWDWNIQTGALLWSEGHYAVLGLQPNECQPSYKVWSKRVHPDDLAETKAKLQQAIATRQEYHHEYRLRWPDDSIHWVEVRGQFTYDAQGNPKHSIGAVVDITERKQSEEALHQALQKLNFHVENTPMAVVEWDQDFRAIRWSAAAERILGWPAAEIIGKSLTEIPFVFEEDLAPVAEVCQRLVYGEESHIFSSNRNYTKQGNIVHCEWYNSSLRDDSGRMTSVLSLVLDVTERKQAEQEREQILERERIARSQAESAQRQLTTLFETSPVGLALLDANQRFIAINEALAEINGLTREQHLGHSIPDLFGQSDPGLVEIFREIYATGNAFISSNFAIHVPGREDRCPGYYNVDYLPTCNSLGQVERVLVYVVDTTDRYRLEQAQSFLAEAGRVLASSLDYQTTLSSIAQLIVPELADWCTVHIVDETGTTQRLAVAHVDPEKVDWANELDQRYPHDPHAVRGVAQVLRTGQSELYHEILDDLLVASAQDEQHLHLLRQVGLSSAMIVPLRVQERSLGTISFVAAESGRRYDAADLDLAEELGRRAALAVENAQLYQVAQRDRAEAEAANRVKDEFLAVLSHELRSPLNPILGWIKLLQKGRLDAKKTAQALETIERNAKLQAQLIEDLLDVSRILQGKITLNVAPVNLAATIKAALETVHLAAEAKNIRIQTHFHPLAGTLLGDTNRLQQVVWNLLSNAVKFTPAGGRVEIRLEQIDQMAQIQVQDTGKGISPEFLSHVFDYFRQEDGTTTRQFGGLGLGLAIVRHLTELHGGIVQVDSPGQNLGATFTVQLPLNLLELHSIPDMSYPTVVTDLTNVQVLVVDDDEDMRELAAFILTQSGAQVTLAASAAQALNLLDQSIPDLLLCDVGMPEIDGYALIQQIRMRHPEQGGTLAAIALTAYAGEINQQQALAAGFHLHIAKPVEPEKLLKAIARLLQRTVDVHLDLHQVEKYSAS